MLSERITVGTFGARSMSFLCRDVVAGDTVTFSDLQKALRVAGCGATTDLMHFLSDTYATRLDVLHAVNRMGVIIDPISLGTTPTGMTISAPGTLHFTHAVEAVVVRISLSAAATS